ncbi:hypothetical protein HYU11_04470 [Candidatus Woesearchaeota archaeon]|nr:hypothetical protein [Candidatus Woesearchaeota archaeon]
MAKVLITNLLRDEIFSKFKSKSEDIFKRMKRLETNPNQGRIIGNVGGVAIKELKYEKFRFYCITDGHVLKFGSDDELAGLLIKFVRMSEKKDQKIIINKIKNILKSFGFDGF